MFNFRNDESGWFQVLQDQTQHAPPSPSTPRNFANNKWGVVLHLLQVAHQETESTSNHPQFRRAKNCCAHHIPSQETSSGCAPGSWLCPLLPGALETSGDRNRHPQTLSPIISRTFAPVGLAPAMNVDWFSHPTYQSDIHSLCACAFISKLLFLLFALFLHKQWLVYALLN